MRGSSKKEPRVSKAAIASLLLQNSSCADCSAKGPRVVSITLGVLVCSNCAGVHASLGSLIRWASDLSPAELEVINSMGNSKVNSILETDTPAKARRPSPSDSYKYKEQWIRDKYRKLPLSNGVQVSFGELRPKADELSSGFLQHHSDKDRAWKRWYFVLSPTFLRSYRTPCDLEVSETIQLRCSSVVVETTKSNEEHYFRLLTPTKTHFLKGDSLEETNDWIERIRNACLRGLQCPHSDEVKGGESASNASVNTAITKETEKENSVSETASFNLPSAQQRQPKPWRTSNYGSPVASGNVSTEGRSSFQRVPSHATIGKRVTLGPTLTTPTTETTTTASAANPAPPTPTSPRADNAAHSPIQPQRNEEPLPSSSSSAPSLRGGSVWAKFPSRRDVPARTANPTPVNEAGSAAPVASRVQLSAQRRSHSSDSALIVLSGPSPEPTNRCNPLVTAPSAPATNALNEKASSPDDKDTTSTSGTPSPPGSSKAHGPPATVLRQSSSSSRTEPSVQGRDNNNHSSAHALHPPNTLNGSNSSNVRPADQRPVSPRHRPFAGPVPVPPRPKAGPVLFSSTSDLGTTQPASARVESGRKLGDPPTAPRPALVSSGVHGGSSSAQTGPPPKKRPGSTSLISARIIQKTESQLKFESQLASQLQSRISAGDRPRPDAPAGTHPWTTNDRNPSYPLSNRILMEGYMLKRGNNVIKDWKYRYFVLSQKSFRYYRSKEEYLAYCAQNTSSSQLSFQQQELDASTSHLESKMGNPYLHEQTKEKNDNSAVFESQTMHSSSAVEVVRPLGAINLIACGAKVSDKFEDKKFCIEICTPQRIYFAVAASAEEMNDWIRAIGEASRTAVTSATQFSSTSVEQARTSEHRLSSEPKEKTIHDFCREGHLYKLGNQKYTLSPMSDWKRRWFTMSPDKISYYANRWDNNPKGTIPLVACNVKRLPEMKEPHCFGIITPNRTYYCRADTLIEVNEWIEAIKGAISLLELGKAIDVSNKPELNSHEESSHSSSREPFGFFRGKKKEKISAVRTHRPTLSDEVAEDIEKFKLDGYAKQYFNKRKGKGRIFSRKIPIAHHLDWSKDPIMTPLLPHASKETARDAVALFPLILAYMGDNPSQMAKDQIAIKLLQFGVNNSALRDEILMQICKQTKNNPYRESCYLGWELLAIALEIFLPTKDMEGYLIGFCEQESAGKDEQLQILIKYVLKKLSSLSLRCLTSPRLLTTAEISYAMKLPFKKTLFGSTLEDVMQLQAGLHPELQIPFVLILLTEHIKNANGFSTEGIFRVSADATRITQLKIALEENHLESLKSATAHEAACLLKSWLDQLHEPLIPNQFYDQCVQHHDDPRKAEEIMGALPVLNQKTISYLFSFLRELTSSQNLPRTRMPPSNVARIFSPLLLRCPVDDPATLLANCALETNFIVTLLQVPPSTTTQNSILEKTN